MDIKFIDDGVNITTLNLKKVATYIDPQGQPVKCVHPVKAQAMLHHITAKASKKGMLVNANKTCLMCVTAAYSHKTEAEITDTQGNKIKSVTSAKFLGVTLDSDCSVTTHVEDIRKKLRGRTWTLNKLKRSGFSEDELVRVYCAYMRPIAEYAAVAWGSMITKEQAGLLERQQNQALKNIFGLGISARAMRERAGIKTLCERRKAAALKFART